MGVVEAGGGEERGGIDGGSGRGRSMGGRGGGGEGGEAEGWRRAEAERRAVALTARTVGGDGCVWAGESRVYCGEE
jgi:hypothetical protein